MSKNECEDCEQLRDSGVACSLEKISINGRAYARQPFIAFQGSPACDDCGTPPGGSHHFPCARERCPVCKASLIECEHASAVVDGSEAEEPSTSVITVDAYVAAMKRALDAFAEHWDGEGFAEKQELTQWLSSFADFLDGDDDDEEAWEKD